jgi:enolase
VELTRVSSYTIFLKSPDPEYSYLVHGYTGAIDVVTNTVAQFLKSVKVISQEDIDRHLLPIERETVELLKQRGYPRCLS